MAAPEAGAVDNRSRRHPVGPTLDGHRAGPSPPQLSCYARRDREGRTDHTRRYRICYRLGLTVKNGLRSAPRGERELFEGGPPLALQTWLGLGRPGKPNFVRRALLVILIGWMPLLVLTIVQWIAQDSGDPRAFLADIAVHTRSLLAAPMLIVAEAVCAPRLNAIAQQFLDAGLVGEPQRPRFDAAVASTRRWLQSPLAGFGVIALAYAVIAGLIASFPVDQLPAWHRIGDAAILSYSAAGWWHAFVSFPLLLLLLLGWIWRLCLWSRFLWLVSRLDLRLIPAHPDHAAGLIFVGHSLRALSVLALALGTILAGAAANNLLRHAGSLFAHAFIVAGAVGFVVALFSAPLLVFSGLLVREWQRGVFAYGALASDIGAQFEHKWFGPGAPANDDNLAAPDFSATTDLYQVVSNVYAMRFVPVDLTSVTLLIGAMLLPFVPVLPLAMPMGDIINAVKSLLF